MVKFFEQNEKEMITGIENIEFTTKAEYQTKQAHQENRKEFGNFRKFISRHTSRKAADVHNVKIEKSEEEFFSI